MNIGRSSFKHFYPRPPRGGRLAAGINPILAATFLSTPSARRATAGAGGRSYRKGVFLSTPSARRATAYRRGGMDAAQNFYPRPPRGGRHFPFRDIFECVVISIHALREEGDWFLYCQSFFCEKFLSTPSARRATAYPYTIASNYRISIHALREEGDAGRSRSASTTTKFLSTPSARRATTDGTGADCRPRYFYPRPPRGGRPCSAASTTRASYFYPRPPRGGRRLRQLCQFWAFVDFYPRPPRGGRRLVR